VHAKKAGLAQLGLFYAHFASSSAHYGPNGKADKKVAAVYTKMQR